MASGHANPRLSNQVVASWPPTAEEDGQGEAKATHFPGHHLGFRLFNESQ
jgi:hypothetical protein